MHFRVIVEIPKGSRNKYEMDHAKRRIRLDRMLFTATTYPSDYGFLPDTLAEDGDPLDALVLLDEPTFPGCQIEVRPVAVFWIRDEQGPDAKIQCVPLHDQRQHATQDLPDMPGHMLNEISHLFEVYEALEPGKTSETRGWQDRAAPSGWSARPTSAPAGSLGESCADPLSWSRRRDAVAQVRGMRLDLDQPVVLGHPFAAGRRAGLELAAAGAHREIGDEGVLGLAGAVRDHPPVAGVAADRHRRQRLGDRADLVELDQRRVPDPLADRRGDDLRVGDEVVVADELDALPEPGGERDPAFLVLLADAVLDAPDREVGDQLGVELDHFGAGQPLLANRVPAVVAAELTRRRVQRDRHPVRPSGVAGVGDGGRDEGEHLLGGGQLGGEPALVAQPGAVPARGQPLAGTAPGWAT